MLGWVLGWVGEGAERCAWECGHVTAARRGVRILCGRSLALDGGDCVGEGDFGLGTPCGAPGLEEAACREGAGPECDEGDQGEPARGGAGDGEVRPLALGFDAEAADVGEGDLDGPAATKKRSPSRGPAAWSVQRNGGAEERRSGGTEERRNGGAEERLRLELAGHVADKRPLDRHLLAGVRPKCRARDDVELPLAAPIPARDGDALPDCLRVGQAPETRGRPLVPGSRGGGSNRRASSRSRVITVRRRRAARRSRAASLLSATAMTSLPGRRLDAVAAAGAHGIAPDGAL